MSSDAKTLAAEVARYPHRRVPRELRRRHLLSVAEELFVERGYQLSSMDELARRAGVSKPVVYDLVGSKEQLFHEVMARFADELAETVATAVSAETDPDRRLHAGALAYFHFVDAHRAHYGALFLSDA